jgi:hypothetical protein
VRLIASSQITFTSALHKTPHTEVHPLSGVTFEVGVLRKTQLSCVASKGGVTGVLKGFNTGGKESRPRIFLVQMQQRGKRIIFARQGGRIAEAMTNDGRFTFREVPRGGKAVCLYAGSRTDTSAASKPFTE